MPRRNANAGKGEYVHRADKRPKSSLARTPLLDMSVPLVCVPCTEGEWCPEHDGFVDGEDSAT